MKPAPVLLALSLLANLILAGAFRLRSSSPPSPPASASAASAAAAAAERLAKSSLGQDATALQAALVSGDPVALAAAGCPPEVIRSLAVGRAFDTFQARMRAVRPRPTDDRYWRRFDADYVASREQRLEASRAERDFSEAIRIAFGEDLDALFSDRDSRRSFLSAAKRDQLQRIERDYSDMEQQIYADQSSGIQLPSDREKLKLLRAEKERDIAAIFTPEEREQFDLHGSNAANQVRARYGEVLQTEEDYKKVYALQKAFDDRYNAPDRGESGPPSAESQRARREAEQKLQEDIRAALGAEQWSAVQRANDQDYRSLTSLSRRLSLAPTAADSVLATRESYAAQSMRINANPALSADERKAQLQALAPKAQAELQAVLGAEGGPAFAQRAGWINWLKNGQAYSLNPKDAGPNVNPGVGTAAYLVPPPKPALPPRD